MDRPPSTNDQPGPQQEPPRDSSAWAPQVDRLHVRDVPKGAVNINVDGRGVVGPLQGFGPLWQKTYRIRLKGANVTPARVIAVWKERFAELQPRQNRIYPSLAGVRPGEVLLLNATMRGIPVNAGLMVLYADDESFTLMTPEGLPESGWITVARSRKRAARWPRFAPRGEPTILSMSLGFAWWGRASRRRSGGTSSLGWRRPLA